jgi:hypothetical protein
MRRASALLVATLALAGAALAASAPIHYVNDRYGYQLDLPDRFGPVHEADNSDGGVSRSDDGQSELSVWGANLLLDSLSGDVAQRIDAAQQEEWEISYRKVTSRWASWSGERNGRIFYSRAILLCHDDQAGFFQIEYPAERREEFDPVVSKLVKSLSKAGCAE